MARPVNVHFHDKFERTDSQMPGNYVIPEEHGRHLLEFAASILPGQVPASAIARDADYDPLRPRPVSDFAPFVEKLLGIATDIPIEWRAAQYCVSHCSDLLTARALASASIGEVLEVTRQNQSLVTNTRTIAHNSRSDGQLAVIHYGEVVHDPIMRFIFDSILAGRLSYLFNLYSGSDRQHQVDMRAGCFGSLMQRLDRELDFIDIDYREGESTFGFSRDTLNHKLADSDERMRIAIDRELGRKAATLPATGKWSDRIKFHIRSNHLSDISLDDICDTFCVQRRTLARLLRDEGTTFTYILTELRREKALHLVRHTGVPLKRVASELGFNSDASFNMAFKSWTGTTPMKFRKAVPARPRADVQPTELALAVEPKRGLRPGLLLTSWSPRISA